MIFFLTNKLEAKLTHVVVLHLDGVDRLGDIGYLVLEALLRIHDILVWIRIWIRGSMPLTNGSGSGSCYFRQ
jgi:hypothetical protein